MSQFTHPLDDYILTRDFYYKADLYIGGQHAAGDYIRETGRTRGARIKAVADGVVATVYNDRYSGYFITVDHADGWSSSYRHLIERASVEVGWYVFQGEAIGYVGNTGVSQGDHLHFDLWCTTKHDPTAFAKHGLWAHDPELYLGKGDDDMALQQVVEEHQKILNNLWDRMKGAEQAIETLQTEIVALRAQVAAGGGGGVSMTRVKGLIRAAGHVI